MTPMSVRGRVLVFAFLLAVITYLDRICISAAAPAIMDELHLTFVQMGLVFSAFTLAYSLFEVPSGWLGDVRGPRRVLTQPGYQCRESPPGPMARCACGDPVTRPQ